jgi:putative multiple sugar transport system permease protein
MKKTNTYFDDLRITLKENVRLYGMFIALAAIMLIFALLTNGLFVSPRNLTNLLDQTGYIAVLAVGMTLVIVIRHIDLSVGYVAGFIGAVAAILMTQYHVPVLVTIIVVLILGIVIGLWNGFLVAFMGLPAFVATLAGMLIFRGLLLLVTQASGTIIIPSDTFNALSNGFIPDILHIPGIHVLSLVLGLLGIIFYIYSEFKTRKNKQKYNFKVLSMGVFLTKLSFISIIILVITLVLATYRGISWTVVIVIVTVAIYHVITNKTILGRHIYAVGGNSEAAELSGINVKKITMIVFGSMGLLAALAGILFAARLRSATQTAGIGFELSAIAAAYIGGTSASGGIGKVTGSVIGAIVMGSLSSGMSLIGMGISLQDIVRGLVLITAVIFDIRTRGKK